MNRVEIAARVAEAEPLRHTPAGTPVLRLRMAHESEVLEAGSPRTVRMELQAVALGDVARELAGTPIGALVQAVGFLAPLRQGSDRLVFHIQRIAQAH
ncbi:primosomal replication protein N [Castellaniella defragrans]|uniref:Replication restart protein PriB n=2 Tax=Castellaniella defragrans TaxID=75697 RepID=W8X9K2_CASD6|nr:primosomal replication protein N [Castellaniella defragrans]KAB0618517.1 primosomal replication protein N [Castellaniella defragrans]MBB6085114.1 primosomal replication protein N [Castellaniella defragrans]CDM24970.1 Primosomal replication protein N [Castellaniella defragrans 65Phen]